MTIAISIHALLAESDVNDAINGCNPDFISIHALLAESDYVLVNTFSAIFEFLSTLSLRRATIVMVGLLMCNLYFYPRSPCGERRWLRCWQLAARDISIHALLAESDESTTIITICIALFLSTLSLRRATVTVLGIQHRTGISIHALLAESDSSIDDLEPSSTHFYPRSPCGERPKTHQ